MRGRRNPINKGEIRLPVLYCDYRWALLCEVSRNIAVRINSVIRSKDRTRMPETNHEEQTLSIKTNLMRRIAHKIEIFA